MTVSSGAHGVTRLGRPFPPGALAAGTARAPAASMAIPGSTLRPPGVRAASLRTGDGRECRLLYRVVVQRRMSLERAPPYKEKPSDLEGFHEKRLKGLEPSTFCMASRRSSQLSYSRDVGSGDYRAGRGPPGTQRDRARTLTSSGLIRSGTVQPSRSYSFMHCSAKPL
jgi:hypothetical protein